MHNNNRENNREKFATLLPLSQWLPSMDIKKSLGQNFLFNLDITDKISLLAHIPDNTTVMEIGPGLGPLTISLLSNYPNMQKLYLVEMDNYLQGHLEKIKTLDNRLEIIMGDCLKVDIPSDVEHIVANLPYNISVPFIMNCLQNSHLKTMTFLVQKEVGERFVSVHNRKSYGKISVLAQLFTKVKIVYVLGPKAFIPAPKVQSVLLHFKKYNENLLYLWPILEDLVRLMFQHRRKMLSNTVCKKYPILLSYVGNQRCENLSPEDILHCAKLIYQKAAEQ